MTHVNRQPPAPAQSASGGSFGWHCYRKIMFDEQDHIFQKVVFAQSPDGAVILKTAYDPNAEERWVYQIHAREP